MIFPGAMIELEIDYTRDVHGADVRAGTVGKVDERRWGSLVVIFPNREYRVAVNQLHCKEIPA